MSGCSVKTILYLGIDPPPSKEEEEIIHFPVIQIVPKPFSDSTIAAFYAEIPAYTHAIFTSKSAVRIFADYLQRAGLKPSDFAHIKTTAVGKATAAECLRYQISVEWIAENESAEGVCEVLKGKIFNTDYVCWPHSALSRRVILDFLGTTRCRYLDCVFYETIHIRPAPIPDLQTIDEIVFTSPSTVEGFLRVYGYFPSEKILKTIGSVTEKQLFLLRDSPSLAKMAAKHY